MPKLPSRVWCSCAWPCCLCFSVPAPCPLGWVGGGGTSSRAHWGRSGSGAASTGRSEAKWRSMAATRRWSACPVCAQRSEEAGEAGGGKKVEKEQRTPQLTPARASKAAVTSSVMQSWSVGTRTTLIGPAGTPPARRPLRQIRCDAFATDVIATALLLVSACSAMGPARIYTALRNTLPDLDVRCGLRVDLARGSARVEARRGGRKN